MEQAILKALMEPEENDEISKHVLITPELARTMLSTMLDNRILSPSVVSTYKAEMQNGTFRNTEDPIAFDTEGHLINGQHRLNAIIQSGIPTMMRVTINVPSDTIFDRGYKRNLGDALYMAGIIDKDISAKQYIAVTNAYFYTKYRHKGRETPKSSDSVKGAFMQDHKEALLETIKICAKGATKPILARRAGAQAAFLGAILSGVNTDSLYSFASIVNTGLYDAKEDSAAAVLGRQLLTDNKNRGSQIQIEHASITEQAIKDFISRTPRKRAYAVGPHPYILQEGEGKKDG